jgi:uncharacterized membrane protein YbhN (UPF0104 family)
MKQRIPLRKIVMVLFVLAAAVYLYRYRADFLALTLAKPQLLIPIALLVIAGLWTNGLFNRQIYRTFNVSLNFKEWFGLSVVNTAGNFIFPLRGGSISTALYLKRVHNLTYTDFITTLSATYVITFWVNSLIGLISMGWIWLEKGIFSALITAMFSGCFLALSLVILFSPKFAPTSSSFLNKFIEAINSWHKIRNNRPIMIFVGFITILNFLLGMMMTKLEFEMLDTAISLAQASLLTIFTSFAGLVSIAPGNLGFREAFTGFSSLAAGLPITTAIAASLMERAVTFLVSLILGIYYSAVLSAPVSSK